MKYGNEASLCAKGHSHRSKLESAVCWIYQMREKAKEIVFVQAEPHIYLTAARILYVPDFELLDVKTNQPLYGEAKGFETPEWRLKRRLWQHYGPGPLEVWAGTHARPFLKETISVKGSAEQ